MIKAQKAKLIDRQTVARINLGRVKP